jgi:Shikimate kinase
VRRVAIIASASGNGKTTLGRALAAKLGVPFVELDALVHGASWQETSDEDLRGRLLGPRVAARIRAAPAAPPAARVAPHARRYSVVRLRSQADIERWLAGVLL